MTYQDPYNQQASADDDHIRLLSIFHYVYAAIVGLTSCLPCIQFLIFPFGMGLFSATGQGNNSAQWAVGSVAILFVLIGAAVFVVILGLAICIAYAGKSMSERRNHLFCLIVAAVNCLSFPLGTTLGVFTFVVLLRPSVKAQFQGYRSGYPQGPHPGEYPPQAPPPGNYPPPGY